jgi:hypothetical protein
VGGGVQLGPLGTAATNRPIVPAPAEYDDGEIGGMIGRGNRSTRRKPAPVPLCPPQTPHATRTRTRAAAVGSQRLTAWATARPYQTIQEKEVEILSTGEPSYWPAGTTPDLLDFYIFKGLSKNYLDIKPNVEIASDRIPIVATISTHILTR